MDLSSPEGHSVNDGIDRELASLAYMSIDDVVAWVLKLGRGTLIAKRDIKQACRNIQVHPQDRPLLGCAGKGSASQFSPPFRPQISHTDILSSG